MPNPQNLWNLFTLMHMMSAQNPAGSWPIGPTPPMSMVGAVPNTLRKEGNRELSTQAYGLVGEGSIGRASANADIAASSLPGLPVMELA